MGVNCARDKTQDEVKQNGHRRMYKLDVYVRVRIVIGAFSVRIAL